MPVQLLSIFYSLLTCARKRLLRGLLSLPLLFEYLGLRPAWTVQLPQSSLRTITSDALLLLVWDMSNWLGCVEQTSVCGLLSGLLQYWLFL